MDILLTSPNLAIWREEFKLYRQSPQTGVSVQSTVSEKRTEKLRGKKVKNYVSAIDFAETDCSDVD